MPSTTQPLWCADWLPTAPKRLLTLEQRKCREPRGSRHFLIRGLAAHCLEAFQTLCKLEVRTGVPKPTPSPTSPLDVKQVVSVEPIVLDRAVAFGSTEMISQDIDALG